MSDIKFETGDIVRITYEDPKDHLRYIVTELGTEIRKGYFEVHNLVHSVKVRPDLGSGYSVKLVSKKMPPPGTAVRGLTKYDDPYIGFVGQSGIDATVKFDWGTETSYLAADSVKTVEVVE